MIPLFHTVLTTQDTQFCVFCVGKTVNVTDLLFCAPSKIFKTLHTGNLYLSWFIAALVNLSVSKLAIEVKLKMFLFDLHDKCESV